MEPEYRLDALLSQPRRASSPTMQADDELSPLLAASDRLTELREATPTPEFARALDAQLRARVDYLRAARAQAERLAAPSPPAARRDSLQPFRLVATGHALRRVPPRVLWPAAAVAALLVLGLGTFAAAASAGPGSPLYFVHRIEQGVQVQLAPNDAARVHLHLQAADEALNQTNTAARNHNDEVYSKALSTLLGEEAAASQALETVPAGSEYDSLASQISDLQARMRRDLAADLPSLRWQNRLSTTAALSGLGVAVPHVSAVTILLGSDQSGADHTGNGYGSAPDVDRVSVSGSGFLPGAMLVVDGHPEAKVVAITVTPTQLVAQVHDETIDHAQRIGILNPDGTAAETGNVRVQDDHSDGGNGNDKHPTATPTATSTPGGHGHVP